METSLLNAQTWKGGGRRRKSKMARKSDSEVLEELAEAKKKVKEAEKELKEVKGEPEYTAEPVSDEPPDIEPPKKPQVEIQEREVNLSLINDKINFIISKVQNLK